MTRKPKSRPTPAGLETFAQPQYVWILHCSKHPSLHAATLDRRARNLPETVCLDGKWIISGQLIVGPTNHPVPGMDVVALKAAIEQDGYYLWNADFEPLPDDLLLMR